MGNWNPAPRHNHGIVVISILNPYPFGRVPFLLGNSLQVFLSRRQIG